jgi:hypothetical protein
MTRLSATQDSYPNQNEPIWSRSEKAIARTAFDFALKWELHEVFCVAGFLSIKAVCQKPGQKPRTDRGFLELILSMRQAK